MNSTCGIVFGGSGLLGPIWIRQLAKKSDLVYVVGLGILEDLSLNALCAEFPDKIVLIERDLTFELLEIKEIGHKFDFAVFNAARDSVPQTLSDVEQLTELDSNSWDIFVRDNIKIFVNCLNYFCKNRKPLAYGVAIGSMYTGVTPRDSNYKNNEVQVFRKHPGYAASKRAIKGILQQFAVSLAPEGVVLNMLSPGIVINGQPDWFLDNIRQNVPSGRFIKREELMPALDFLTSKGAEHLIGQEILLDGGYSLW